MNPQTDTAAHAAFDAQTVAPAPLSPTRPMYWSVRRELWENRSIVYAPLIAAALVMFGLFVSTMTLPHRLRAIPAADTVRQHHAVAKAFDFAPVPVILTALLVGVFYCLDALHGERRDRSILFWKSLPVSDRTTVLAKAAIPLAVLPLIAIALSIVVQILLLQLGTMVVMGHGRSPAPLWGEARFFQGLVIMFYGLGAHVLWFAPIYGWLMLVSAWAKRAPVLWALLPPLAISAVERITFGTKFFMNMLQYRVTGAMKEAFVHASPAAKGSCAGCDGNIDRLSQLDPARLLGAPGLWVGLLFAAACFAVAVRLRRNREPI